MTLTPLESRVLAVSLKLLAAGVIPTGRELAARIPSRTTSDLVRVRNRLASRGQLPADAGRTASRACRGPAPIGDAERREVIDACLEFIAAGVYPSVDRLRRRLPRIAAHRLMRIRDEAASAGLIVPGTPANRGLLGLTEEELEEVEDRTEAIRAEKVKRGEVARPVETRVVRDRSLDRWFQGRHP